MILSRKHHYIFLHCRKTAGTAMKVAMSPHFGPRDICLGAWQEIMKTRRLPNRQYVRDALNARAIERIARDVLLRRNADYFWHMNKMAYRSRLGRASSHPTAARIKACFPDEWDRYFKYTIVRNPFSVAVSAWRQRVANRGGYMTFPDYMRAWARVAPQGTKEFHAPNWELVAVDDVLDIDLVLRHENLPADLKVLSNRLGLPIDLPRVNVKGAPMSYRDQYCTETRRIAEAMFEKELNAFGYDF